MVLPIKPINLAAVNGFVPVIEISVSKQQSAENYLVTNKTKTAVVSLGCKDELMSKQQAESLPEPAPGTFLVVPTEVPEVQAAGSVAKLQIAQPVAVMTKPGRAPSSPGTQTQPEIELLLDLLESPQTVIGPCCDWCSVRRSLVRKFSQAHRAFLIRKDSVVPKKISSARRSSRKLALEPAVTGYITCHSYLERLLGVEVFRKASSEEEVKCARETEQEAPEGTRRRLHSQNTNKISISSPRAQPGSGSQADDDSESEMDQSEEPRVLPENVGGKRIYKQAVSELDENGDHIDDEALTPPRTKAPSPVCPPSKEKERQQLENLKKKEEAELMRKQMVEEDKRRHLKQVKMKWEARLLKVLLGRQQAEQLEVEKKTCIEQKLAQLEKNK